jgi:pilus assembly protein Flp/PilA
MARLFRFLSDEEGATGVEYAVLLALILLSCISAVALVGQRSADLWSDNNSGLQQAFQHVQ